MPADFEPILKQNHVEPFVTTTQSTTIATNIFVSAGLMLFAMIITWLMIWSYQKNQYLFITLISFFAILFAVVIVIVALINMGKLDELTFKITLGSSVMFGFIYLIIAIIFVIRFFQDQRSASSSSYIPPSVQSYIDH